MNTKPLYFVAGGGLANRLRALVGYGVLSELKGRPLHLVWPQDGACAAGFSVLFETPKWKGFAVSEVIPDEASGEGEIHRGAWPFMNVWSNLARDLVSRELFAARAMTLLAALRPREALLARIDRFSRDHGLSACTGIHVRATDNLHTYAWWAQNAPHFQAEKVSRLEGFEVEVQRLHALGEGMFLASDSEAAVVRLTQCAKGHVTTLDKQFDAGGYERHVQALTVGQRVVESWRTTPIEDALVELYLLARCRRIVGTYWSSFGWIAALIGRVPFLRVEGTAVVVDNAAAELVTLAGQRDASANLSSSNVWG